MKSGNSVSDLYNINKEWERQDAMAEKAECSESPLCFVTQLNEIMRYIDVYI